MKPFIRPPHPLWSCPLPPSPLLHQTTHSPLYQTTHATSPADYDNNKSAAFLLTACHPYFQEGTHKAKNTSSDTPNPHPSSSRLPAVHHESPHPPLSPPFFFLFSPITSQAFYTLDHTFRVASPRSSGAVKVPAREGRGDGWWWWSKGGGGEDKRLACLLPLAHRTPRSRPRIVYHHAYTQSTTTAALASIPCSLSCYADKEGTQPLPPLHLLTTHPLPSPPPLIITQPKQGSVLV